MSLNKKWSEKLNHNNWSLICARATESRRRHRTSPSQPNPTSKAPHDRICRAPKRSRHRSSGRHHPRESVSVPPLHSLPHSPLIADATSTAPHMRYSIREKRKRVRRVMHKRMSQQRVADWLVSTHGNQAAACTSPLFVF